MANFIGVLQTTEIALAASTVKTVLQLTAPANHRLRLLRMKVSFDGISPTAEPAQVRLLRQTSAGTMSSLNPVKQDNSLAEALLSTGASNATAEPTAGDVLDSVEVHPQSGYEVIYPYGQEPMVGGSGRLGIDIQCPSVVNVRALLVYEE